MASDNFVSQLWRNTGSGFTNVTASVAPGLPGVVPEFRGVGRLRQRRAAGFPAHGIRSAVTLVSQLWRNTGSGFTNVTAMSRPACRELTQAPWRGAIMTTTAGWTSCSRGGDGGNYYSQLWHNNTPFSNAPPTAPLASDDRHHQRRDALLEFRHRRRHHATVSPTTSAPAAPPAAMIYLPDTSTPRTVSAASRPMGNAIAPQPPAHRPDQRPDRLLERAGRGHRLRRRPLRHRDQRGDESNVEILPKTAGRQRSAAGRSPTWSGAASAPTGTRCMEQRSQRRVERRAVLLTNAQAPFSRLSQRDLVWSQERDCLLNSSDRRSESAPESIATGGALGREPTIDTIIKR